MITTMAESNVRCLPRAGNKTVVTTIMIFLNAERFIEEAIESVFGQSFEEWELLLVDDGSTDGSTAVAQCYAVRYPEKIRYLEHEGHSNRGMSASRNLGLMHAQGEFIAFLDADDVWLPQKLEQQVEILNSHPAAAMVLGATQYWYSWTGNSEDEQRDFVPELGVTPDTVVKPPTLVRLLLQNQIATSTGSLTRREIMERVGGYDESFRGMFEDQVFHSKVSLKSPVFVSSRCWYKYRKHADSCCAVAEDSNQHNEHKLTFLKWLDAYASTQGISDPDLRVAIKKERWKSRHWRLSRLGEAAQYRTRTVKDRLKTFTARVLPVPVYRWLRSHRPGIEERPAVGLVRFGDLRRLTPISRVFGFDRGTPIDRYYIESFLARHSADFRGRVLEVGDDSYTRRFGGNRVTQSDVLHVSEENQRATIIADLAGADHIPSGTFDCIVLTQTLHLIYDVRAALSTLHRILAPGGVMLATFPGISQIDHYDWSDSWYWAFTPRSARRLFEEAFTDKRLSIATHGNVLAATAFLQGISREELREDELDYEDADYPVTITVRVVKESKA